MLTDETSAAYHYRWRVLGHGRRLVWQEGKSESFSFTSLYCGGTVTSSDIEKNTAYRKTESYAYPPVDVYLGTALAVSGVAVSPLLGFHCSSVVGLPLTVFNARLRPVARQPQVRLRKEPLCPARRLLVGAQGTVRPDE